MTNLEPGDKVVCINDNWCHKTLPHPEYAPKKDEVCTFIGAREDKVYISLAEYPKLHLENGNTEEYAYHISHFRPLKGDKKAIGTSKGMDILYKALDDIKIPEKIDA